jgi:hypothetical protein
MQGSNGHKGERMSLNPLNRNGHKQVAGVLIVIIRNLNPNPAITDIMPSELYIALHDGESTRM